MTLRSNVSLPLVVTEPSLSGIHDLERVLAVCRHFGVRALVCTNKHDLDGEAMRRIQDYCCRTKIDVAAMIPFGQTVTEAVVRGLPVVEYSDGAAARCIAQLWRDLTRRLREDKRAHARV